MCEMSLFPAPVFLLVQHWRLGQTLPLGGHWCLFAEFPQALASNLSHLSRLVLHLFWIALEMESVRQL